MKKLTYVCILFLSISKSYGLDVIVCHTPQERHEITLGKNQVTFIDRSNPQKRSVASSQRNVRTKMIGNSLTKIMNRSGSKHTIHVNNIKEFNVANDYLSIRSAKGHVMTYPLECD